MMLKSLTRKERVRVEAGILGVVELLEEVRRVKQTLLSSNLRDLMTAGFVGY